MASAAARSGQASSSRLRTAKGSSNGVIKTRPIALTISARLPFLVSISAVPRPGVPLGKFAGRTSRGARSIKTSASR